MVNPEAGIMKLSYANFRRNPIGNRAISVFCGQKPCTRIILGILQSLLHFVKPKDIVIWNTTENNFSCELEKKIQTVQTQVKFHHQFHYTSTLKRPCPHVSRNLWKRKYFLRIRLASTRIQRIFRPYPEIFQNALQRGNFLSDTNTYTCGRSYPQIFEYAYVILLAPVFTASIKQTWRTARLCLLC